jgi:hypothetical protein
MQNPAQTIPEMYSTMKHFVVQVKNRYGLEISDCYMLKSPFLAMNPIARISRQRVIQARRSQPPKH